METLRPDPSWFEIDPAFYRHGGSCLNTAEAEAIDTRPGQSVLVTPPGSGEEAISLANLGARVTVLGSEPALRQARELAGRAGVSLAFSEGDAANPEVPGDPFDAVSVQWVRFSAKLPSLKLRLLAAGMITTKQLTGKTGVPRTTISRWRTKGLIQARMCAEFCEWLCWLSEQIPPYRGAPKRQPVGTSTARGA